MTIRALRKRRESEKFVPIDFDDVDDFVDEDDLVWVDIQTRDAREIEKLKRFGVANAIIKDSVGQEQLPKYEADDDEVFVILHSLSLVDGVLDTTQINCVLKPSLFITVAERQQTTFNWLWDQVQKTEYGSTDTADQLFGHLAELIGHHYLEVINEFDDLIDDVYDRALTAQRHVLGQVQLLRREATSISKVLRPQRVVLNDLRRLHHVSLSETGRSLISDAFDVHNLVVESLRSARSMLADTLDTYRGATGDRQSTASTVLAVYSAVMLPLTVLGGYYGMNVKLPGENADEAWIYITGAMLLIAAISLLVFLRVGFIRFPDRKHRKAASAFREAAEARLDGEHFLTRQAERKRHQKNRSSKSSDRDTSSASANA